MVDFLGQFDQFPCRSKDGFIPLFLPEFDIERAIRELTLY
jgi:hypothetical protein